VVGVAGKSRVRPAPIRLIGSGGDGILPDGGLLMESRGSRLSRRHIVVGAGGLGLGLLAGCGRLPWQTQMQTSKGYRIGLLSSTE
jgi:hypothetical protein